MKMTSGCIVHSFNTEPCTGLCKGVRDIAVSSFGIISILSLLMSIPNTYYSLLGKLWILWLYSNETHKFNSESL